MERYEICKDKLYFLCVEDTWKGQRNDCNNLYYCVDDVLIYTAFFADFGPLDLGLTYKFCSELVALLNDAEKSNKLVYFYSSKHPHRYSLKSQSFSHSFTDLLSVIDVPMLPY